MPVRIFLSTVSDEFRDYRDQLRADLTRHNTEVKVQEDFKDYGASTLHKLDTYIKSCDAVVHLVGDMTGSVAQTPSTAFILDTYPDIFERLPVLRTVTGFEGVSYTQWEAWLALYHKKLLFIAKADPAAPRGPKYVPTAETLAAQHTHVERLQSVERYPGCTFKNPENLARQIAYTGLLDLLAADVANTRPAALVEPLVDIATMVFVDLMRLTCVAGSNAARAANERRYPEFVDVADLHLTELKTHITRVTNHLSSDSSTKCLAMESRMSHVLVRLRRGPELDRDWRDFCDLLESVADQLLEFLRRAVSTESYNNLLETMSTAKVLVQEKNTAAHLVSPDDFVAVRFAAQSAFLSRIDASSELPIRTIRDDIDKRLALPYFAIDAWLLRSRPGAVKFKG